MDTLVSLETQHPPAALSAPFVLSSKPAFKKSSITPELAKEIAATASVTILGHEWAEAVVSLNGKIRKKLTETNQSHFLRQLRKSNIKHNYGPIIGVVAKHKSMKSNPLIGGMLVTYPRFLEKEDVLKGYPLNGAMDVTAMFRAVMVHPDFGNLKISQKLLEGAEYAASGSGHSYAIARIDSQNFGSQGSFAKAGFTNIGEPHTECYGTAHHWKKTIWPMKGNTHG